MKFLKKQKPTLCLVIQLTNQLDNAVNGSDLLTVSNKISLAAFDHEGFNWKIIPEKIAAHWKRFQFESLESIFHL